MNQTNTLPQLFSDKLVAKLDLAYICLDPSLMVLSCSSNIEQFGFPQIPVGSDITDYLDFMVGMDVSSELYLAMLMSPKGNPVSVRLLPDEGENIIVVISDASNYYEQRQVLQQHANENELLLNQQKKLMLQLADASRLQTSFLSGVSHEFRTPLSSIIGYTNLLHRHIDLISEQAPRANSYLTAIKRSSSHLLSLVENLLDHGKLDSGEIILNPKSTHISQLFDDVAILLEPLTATKNIKFEVVCNVTDDTMLLIDDSRLRQCLINLIGNAIKFTDKGSVRVEASWQDDMLKVLIKDTGLGISKDNLQNIFQPFWQAPDTGKAGTGLGLTITNRIIELMGGELIINSKLNVGTTVEFDLLAPRINSKEIEYDDTAIVDRSISILLAEDDDDIAELVELLLSERGAQVTRVENGALAVEITGRTKFDLILMDIHMPVLSGYEAIQLIRERGDDSAIVVMSASPLESTQSQIETLDYDGYLVKPVDVDDIFRIANEIISN